jgi:DHA1 family multidrug resistance protein-like MFS transporter
MFKRSVGFLSKLCRTSIASIYSHGSLIPPPNIHILMADNLSMGMGNPIPLPFPDTEKCEVKVDVENDLMHPYNWKLSTKYVTSCPQADRLRCQILIRRPRLFISILVCSGAFIVTLTSAIFAPAAHSASQEFDVAAEIGALGTTTYVLGFAFGPMIWAPGSEIVGRRWPLTIAMLGGGVFTIASTSARDIQTLIICRFFAGMCAASQLTVVPGVLADLYDHTHRGIAISLYALTFFVGPFCAPLVGGFIVASDLGWRWTLYISAILSFANGIVSLLFLRETYAPCLLPKHRIEVDAKEVIEKYFARPLRMLVTEPIILLLSLYMSFIYGLVYCLLVAYPYVFEEIHGFAPGVSGLPFLGLIIGQVLAVAFILSYHAAYVEKLVKNNNIPIPEWRLIPTFFGAPVFAIGIFWCVFQSRLKLNWE